MLNGAAAMDAATRIKNCKEPCRSARIDVVSCHRRQRRQGYGCAPLQGLPHALSKYLQQLVMESLGKELDLDGKMSIKASPCMATKVLPTSTLISNSPAKA